MRTGREKRVDESGRILDAQRTRFSASTVSRRNTENVTAVSRCDNGATAM